METMNELKIKRDRVLSEQEEVAAEIIEALALTGSDFDKFEAFLLEGPLDDGLSEMAYMHDRYLNLEAQRLLIEEAMISVSGSDMLKKASGEGQ